MDEHTVVAEVVAATGVAGPASARSSKTLVCITLPSRSDKVWVLTIATAGTNTSVVRFRFDDSLKTFTGVCGRPELDGSIPWTTKGWGYDLGADRVPVGVAPLLSEKPLLPEEHAMWALEMGAGARCVVTAVTDASAPNPFADQFSEAG